MLYGASLMLPNFVIIGAQKSASTFLQVCLSEHPDIFMPRGETTYFQSPDYEQRDISDLKQKFADRQEKRLGIKRADYIGRPEVPQRIASHLPQAKLLAVLRNPIDRAVSAYYHQVDYGFIPPIDVEKGMRKIISEPSFSDTYRRAPDIIEFGFYHKYLSLYEHFIKNDQLLVMLHEDISLDPLACVQKAYEYLDVFHEFEPGSLNTRPQRVTYNLTRLKFVVLRNRFLYSYNSQRTRLFAKKGNPTGKAIAAGITMMDRKILSRFLSNDRPALSAELQQILYDIYADDIDALEVLIGRDLSIWRPNFSSRTGMSYHYYGRSDDVE
jgi:hypothetical protein